MMRRLVPMLLALATVAAGPVAAQSHTDFSGKWQLDASKSQGMGIPQSAELAVTQTDKSLTLTRSAVGPAGQVSNTLVYQLDGTASKNVVGGNGMTVDLSSQAAWDGPTLVITTTASSQGDFKQTERWSLQDGGKVLVLQGEIAVGGQNATAKMVFNKK